ncbi:MAG: hypothetical protein Q4C67_06555 [Deinococcus sp.]|nr:hypothetical protein [Deinococcus sp.]
MTALTISGIHDFPDLDGVEAIISIRDPGDELPAEVRSATAPVFDLIFHDVLEDDEHSGYVSPEAWQLERLLSFLHQVRPQRLHIHCFYGVSRSTAVASFILAAKRPELSSEAIVRRVREVRAQACPNPRLLSLADDLLGSDLTGAWGLADRY